VLHEDAGTNRVWRGVFEYGDIEKAFREAAHIVRIDKMHFHRFSSTPLESNAVIGQWTGAMSTSIIGATIPSFVRDAVHCGAPRCPHRQNSRSDFRYRRQFWHQDHQLSANVGCALASKKAGGRPVKWIETRSEHNISSAHGNERTFRDTRVALDKDGVITAIDSRHIDDCGAYPRYEPLGCVIWGRFFRAFTASGMRASTSARQ